MKLIGQINIKSERNNYLIRAWQNHYLCKKIEYHESNTCINCIMDNQSNQDTQLLCITRDKSYIDNNGNRKYYKQFSIISIDDVEDYIDSIDLADRVFYQHFTNNNSVKGYLDIDCKLEHRPNDISTAELELLTPIIVSFNRYFADIMGIEDIGDQIKWMESHGELENGGFKLSFAGILPIIFSDPLDVGVVIGDIASQYEEIAELIKKGIIDMSVYARKQHIRLMNCHKLGSNRVRIPATNPAINPVVLFENQLITMLDDDDYEIFPKDIINNILESRKKDHKDREKTKANRDDVEKMLEYFPNDTLNWAMWNLVGLCIHHDFGDDGLDLFLKWCAKNPENDEKENILHYDSYTDRHDANTAGCGLLFYKLKNTLPDQYDELMRKIGKKEKTVEEITAEFNMLIDKEIKKKQPKEGYIPPYNFITMPRDQTFDKMEVLSYKPGCTFEFLQNFAKRNFVIVKKNKKKYAISTTKDKDDVVRWDSDIYNSVELKKNTLGVFKQIIKNKGKKNEEIVDIRITEFDVIESIKHEIMYENDDFIPYNLYYEKPKDPKLLFNRFGGFRIWPIAAGICFDQSKCQGLIDHVKEVFCSNNEEYYTYLFNLLAIRVQRPDLNPGISLVLNGIEGTGKTCFIEQFAERIFGQEYVLLCNPNSNPLKENFNSDISSKMMIIMNEERNRGYFDVMETLKTFITDKRQRIKEKYVRAKMMDINIFIVITLNNYLAAISETDRRFFVLKPSEKYANDESYFKPLFFESDEKMDEKWAHFYLYLLTQFEPTKFNFRNIPQTEILKEYKADSLTTAEKYIKFILSKEYESRVICVDECSLDDKIKFHTGELAQEINNSQFLKNETNKSKYTTTQLNRDLSKSFTIKRVTINGIRKSGIVTTYRLLLELFNSELLDEIIENNENKKKEDDGPEPEHQ